MGVTNFFDKHMRFNMTESQKSSSNSYFQGSFWVERNRHQWRGKKPTV